MCDEYTYRDIKRLAQYDYLKGHLNKVGVFTIDNLGNRLKVNLKDGSDEVYDVNEIKNQYIVIDDISLEYYEADNLTEGKDG